VILALRQRHRRMFAVIGVLLPIVFAAGIAARKPVPRTAALPAGLEVSSKHFATTEWSRNDLFAKTPIQVHLLREEANAGPFAVSFVAPKDFVKPDLIVYWVVGSTTIADTLPDNALLLGSFCSPALPLPDEASKADGMLVLYNLAENEIVDVTQAFVAANVTSRQASPLHANSRIGRRLTPATTEQ
jgi:hypothetical protein